MVPKTPTAYYVQQTMFRPADNPARAPNPYAVRPRTPAASIVFCVDDDAADRQLFGRLLQQPGLDYPCHTFGCGEDLLDALLNVLRGAPPPLACFVDVKMDGMSGFDVLRWIRCQHALDCVPVIMMSSCEDPAVLVDAASSGAQCYVAKFPTAAQLRELMYEAERYSAAHSSAGAFQVPFNLLRGANPAASGAGAGSSYSSPIAGVT